ncbi:MAG: ABC transporter substrate-binding protein [Gammaproteobacteria bacterium]|nr:ABC transporter substrate-binding protein [Gammaproteobacteria bacterium]
MEMAHAKTFSAYERDGYRIVDFKAPVVSWGGNAKGADQQARVVLVPKNIDPPELTGDLENAVLVRTPVERVAVNYGFLEATLTTLGVEDRLVAVGGVKSYHDEIRARARSGDVAQVGYGWHMPPSIDTLIGAQPDVFFTVLGDLGHAEHYERIKDLGVPVVPIFLEAETTYMGPVDYVRLLGMFVGKEDEANAYADMVAKNVDTLKARVAEKPKKHVLRAWFAGSGRWMVTIRNAENQLLSDAGGVNPMALQDDIRLDDFTRIGSEILLERARDVDCWIIRDAHSQAFTDEDFLQHFKAWRNGCLFASDGSTKPEADAFDYYETGPIRPDYVLRDLVGMLHPDASSEPFKYIQPDNETPRP